MYIYLFCTKKKKNMYIYFVYMCLDIKVISVFFIVVVQIKKKFIIQHKIVLSLY